MFRALPRLNATVMVKLGITLTQGDFDLLNLVGNLDADWNRYKAATPVRGTIWDVAGFLQAKYGIDLQELLFLDSTDMECFPSPISKERLDDLWGGIAVQLRVEDRLHFERDF